MKKIGTELIIEIIKRFLTIKIGTELITKIIKQFLAKDG